MTEYIQPFTVPMLDDGSVQRYLDSLPKIEMDIGPLTAVTLPYEATIDASTPTILVIPRGRWKLRRRWHWYARHNSPFHAGTAFTKRCAARRAQASIKS